MEIKKSQKVKDIERNGKEREKNEGKGRREILI